MKLSSVSRLLAAACAVLALSSADAFAQPEVTPTLTVTATGNVVDISWTPIAINPPGLQYELAAGSASGAANLFAGAAPATLFGSSPHLRVTAPNGGYYIRVRARLGTIAGPWSNEAFVGVGLESCTLGVVPTVSVSVQNSNASVSWTAVPGTISYLVQWSRFPGQTEFTDTVVGTSTTRTVPLNGTFYVRVVAVTNGCGNAASAEAPFTINVVKRYLSPGEIVSHLNATAAAYPRAWQQAHSGSSESWDFIILACRRLYTASGGTIGCNFRRAVVGDVSMDGLSIENPSDGRYYFADVIAGAGGPNPSIYLPGLPFYDGALLRDSSGRYAPWGFANPFGSPVLRTTANYGPAGGW
jgi:hypothetical protein